jgi:hypothetical protein
MRQIRLGFWVMTGLERKLRLKQGAGLYPWAEKGIANRRNTEGAIINDTDPIDPVNDRAHFAFLDVRKLITQAALDKDFDIVCPKLNKRRNNSLIDVLLRMVA